MTSVLVTAVPAADFILLLVPADSIPLQLHSLIQVLWALAPAGSTPLRDLSLIQVLWVPALADSTPLLSRIRSPALWDLIRSPARSMAIRSPFMAARILGRTGVTQFSNVLHSHSNGNACAS